MSRLSALTSARTWSWLLAVTSIALPFAWFLQQQRAFAKWAAEQDGMVCGMPMLGVLIVCTLLAFVLSFFAMLTGWSGYRALPAPRPGLRLLEVLFVGGIFVVGFVGIVVASLASLLA